MYIIFIKRCKGTKSRGQNKTNSFVFYAETKYLRDFLPQRYKKKLKLQLYREIIAKRTTFGRLQSKNIPLSQPLLGFPPRGDGRGGQLISNVCSDDVNISDRTGIAVGLGFLDA